MKNRYLKLYTNFINGTNVKSQMWYYLYPNSY